MLIFGGNFLQMIASIRCVPATVHVFPVSATAKLAGRVKIVAALTNRSINVYPDAQSMALMT